MVMDVWPSPRVRTVGRANVARASWRVPGDRAPEDEASSAENVIPSRYEELSTSAATAKVMPVLSTAYFMGFDATPSRCTS